MPRPPAVRSEDVGIRRASPARVRPETLAAVRHDRGDRVVLGSLPLCPAANAVFTPAEMDARLAALSERLLAADPGPEPVHCWGCGATLPAPGLVVGAGWWSRPFRSCGAKKRELACPACHARYGFGGDRP